MIPHIDFHYTSLSPKGILLDYCDLQFYWYENYFSILPFFVPWMVSFFPYFNPLMLDIMEKTIPVSSVYFLFGSLLFPNILMLFPRTLSSSWHFHASLDGILGHDRASSDAGLFVTVQRKYLIGLFKEFKRVAFTYFLFFDYLKPSDAVFTTLLSHATHN